MTNEGRLHLKKATRALEAANLIGSAVEMNLQLSLAGVTLYTVGMVPEAGLALNRARELAFQRKDTEYQLRCLRMVASYQLSHGENHAAVHTLQEFLAKAAISDASALPEGEAHLSLVELLIGLLASAKQRLERLYAEGLKELDDSNSLRFLYNHTILRHVHGRLRHARSGDRSAAARSARLAPPSAGSSFARIAMPAPWSVLLTAIYCV